jgi:hypothetical protein
VESLALQSVRSVLRRVVWESITMPGTTATDDVQPLPDSLRREFEAGMWEADWTAEYGTTPEQELEMRRLVREHQELARFVTSWAEQSRTHLKLYRMLLLRPNGVLLSDLHDVIDASNRTVARRVAELVDVGLIERGGYPTAVSLAEPRGELHALLHDLSRLISDNE